MMKAKDWDDPYLTEQDAYEMGKRDALEAIQNNLEDPWGMTWDEEERQHFNLAFDRGAKEVLKGYVISRFPKAEAVEHDEHDNFWHIEAGPLELCDYVNGTEYDAWEQAAKNVHQAMH